MARSVQTRINLQRASASRLEFAMALKKFCLNGDAAATGDGRGVKAFASVSSSFRHKQQQQQQHFFSLSPLVGWVLGKS
jgi:hypothetical protein